MALKQLHKDRWINPDLITHIHLWKDEDDGDLEKATVYFVGRDEPLKLIASDTQRLLYMIDPNKK